MDTILVTHKAKWNFQEILPIIILGALGLFGVFQGITQAFTLAGSIITAVVGFGLALYIISISSSRKWKSTLFARLTEDKNLNIEVWMRKPIEDKWVGKLDEGKNKAKLANINGVKIETIRGTRVLAIKTNEGRLLYIPIRLAETDELKSFISKAVAHVGGKLTFEDKDQAKEFATLIAGGANIVSTKTPVIAPVKTKSIDEQIAEEKAEEEAALAAKVEAKVKAEPTVEEIVEEKAATVTIEEELIPQIVKTKHKIDYREYYTMSATDLITNALIDVEEKAAEAHKEEKVLTISDINSIDSLFGSAGSNAVSINLDPNKKA